jgi:hypothetical protein
MHEEMDVINPETEKEDCELKAFERLAQRLKKEFPKLAICLVADSLYCCQAVVTICQLFDWKYVLTLKEGRQPTIWDETIRLLPFNRGNRLRLLLGQDGKAGHKIFAGWKTSINSFSPQRGSRLQRGDSEPPFVHFID